MNCNWNLTMIKFVQVLFAFWCVGVGKNGHTDAESLNVSTSIVPLRPTTVVDISANASQTAALSQMTFAVKTPTIAAVPNHHSSVKATKITITSRMTASPTRRSGTDTHASSDSSNLSWTTIGFIVAAIGLVVVVTSIVTIIGLHGHRKNKKSSNNSSREEIRLSQLRTCPPDTSSHNIEIPAIYTSLSKSIIEIEPNYDAVIVGDNSQVIYDKKANTSSSLSTTEASTNLVAEGSRGSTGESRKELTLDNNYDENRRATMSSTISTTSTNFSSGLGESYENLGLEDNYEKNRRATISSYRSQASTSTRRSSGFSEDSSLDKENRTATMSSSISRTSTNVSSGLGESYDNLGLEDNYEKNRRATMSSYRSRGSTSTRRSSGFSEDSSLDKENRTATMSSSISRTSTNLSTGGSSGFDGSCEDLSPDNNFEKDRRATISHSRGAYTNQTNGGCNELSESCEDLNLDNTYDANSKYLQTLPRLSHKDMSIRCDESRRKARSLPASVAKREEWTPMSSLKKDRSKPSRPSEQKHSNSAKKHITTEGGVLKKDDIILKIPPGCLAEDTEITLIQDDENSAFKALLDFGLIDAAARVVEFLPDGLKFLKPADLTIRCEKTASDSELFILHGSNNCEYQSLVWEVVTNTINDHSAEGVVNMKIYGFCFFSYISAKRWKLARILSHLNHSFSCVAYAFYRRLPSMDTIDISVVMLSMYVDKKRIEKIKQLKDHFEEGYIKADKGMGKRIHTRHPLEISLDFPDVESFSFSFMVDQPELDTDGFVINRFKGTTIKSPAHGAVKIKEADRSVEDEFVWMLKIHEMERGNRVEEIREPEPQPKQKVEYRDRTKLTNQEISRMSRMVGVDWDSLAGLMDIPYSEREEIRLNQEKYPNSFAKAEQILALFNFSECFGRNNLEKCVEELGLHDLKNEMMPVAVDEETSTDNEHEEEKGEIKSEVENVELRNTPLSPREMCRLSRRIAVDWDSLAGLMDIAKEERDNIKNNRLYYDDRSRAEKILSMFNRKKGFTRKKLTTWLKEIGKSDSISPIITGEWRNLRLCK